MRGIDWLMASMSSNTAITPSRCTPGVILVSSMLLPPRAGPPSLPASARVTVGRRKGSRGGSPRAAGGSGSGDLDTGGEERPPALVLRPRDARSTYLHARMGIWKCPNGAPNTGNARRPRVCACARRRRAPPPPPPRRTHESIDDMPTGRAATSPAWKHSCAPAFGYAHAQMHSEMHIRTCAASSQRSPAGPPPSASPPTEVCIPPSPAVGIYIPPSPATGICIPPSPPTPPESTMRSQSTA